MVPFSPVKKQPVAGTTKQYGPLTLDIDGSQERVLRGGALSVSDKEWAARAEAGRKHHAARRVAVARSAEARLELLRERCAKHDARDASPPKPRARTPAASSPQGVLLANYNGAGWR